MADKDFKVKNGLNIQSPLAISMGGTGQTSSTNAINALLPIQSSGRYLTTDGSNVSWDIVPYSELASMGITVSARKTINFYGVDLVDDSINNRTNVTINLAATGLDGGWFDSVSMYDGGDPSVASYSYTINGGTP